MFLPKAFQSKIRAVQVRCGVNLLLRQAGRVLMAAGAIAALAVLAERLLALQVLTPWMMWSFSGMAAVAVLVLWFLVLPSRMQASLLLDERLGLSERVSTTLALAASDDPFARAARAESLHVVEHSNLAGHFPIKLSRSWGYGAGTWVVTVAMVFLLPQRDLLGFLKEREQEQKKEHAAQLAQAEVKKITEKVKDAVRALGEPNLVADLKKLDQLTESPQPEEIKREAIKALGDLADKIRQMQANSQLNAAAVLQQTFKQLRGSSNPFSQELRMMLAKGDYAQAAGMLAQLQSQLSEGSLPADKRKELAAQMQDLAKELQKLSEQKRQIEEELAKLGLDKELAQATPEQLRQALQQKGLSPEMVNQLMQKIQAGQAAAASCAGLGQALAGMAGSGSGLAAGDLSGVIDELNALDAMQQQAYMLQVSLAEISNLMAGLGEGMGKSGHWDIGQGGGHGDGIGTETTDDHRITSDPLNANKKTKVTGRPDESPVVASWYFKDTQVKGEAQRSFVEVVQAGRASAAEALSENQIPRRYEDAVKAYFNQLEESGPKP